MSAVEVSPQPPLVKEHTSSIEVVLSSEPFLRRPGIHEFETAAGASPELHGLLVE
jgi:hypothetical protein